MFIIIVLSLLFLTINFMFIIINLYKAILIVELTFYLKYLNYITIYLIISVY